MLFRKSPAEKFREKWTKWLDAQIHRGVPRQRLWLQLLQYKKTDTLEEMQARGQLAQDISNLLFTRNQQGGELERAGSVDEAVALYEANIADEFPGDYPYERLRIIYSKRGDYQSAHRVCAAYLQAKPDGKLRTKYDGYILQYHQKLK